MIRDDGDHFSKVTERMYSLIFYYLEFIFKDQLMCGRDMRGE